MVVSTCAWNKTWAPSTLDPCVATSCQVIPFPPPDIGMQHMEDEKNQITLESEFTVYNPKLAFTMKFPGPEFCGDNGDIMMVVGSVPKVTLGIIESLNINSIFRKVRSLLKWCTKLEDWTNPSTF